MYRTRPAVSPIAANRGAYRRTRTAAVRDCGYTAAKFNDDCRELVADQKSQGAIDTDDCLYVWAAQLTYRNARGAQARRAAKAA